MKSIGFVEGFFTPLRAWTYIVRHPSVWPLCVLPLVINVAVVVGVWMWTGGFAERLLGDAFTGTTWLADVLRGFVVLLTFLLRLFLLLVAFVVVGSMASAPFNDVLSERVDRAITGWSDEQPFSAKGLMRSFVRTPIMEFRRLMVYALITVVLFVLSFIPLLAAFTLPAQIGVSAAFFALDQLSYPLERRGIWALREKFAYVRRHARASFGFGWALTLIFLVPLVNFLFIPVAVVGGTLLFARIEEAAAAKSAGVPVRRAANEIL
ncbi:hypothetical protein CVU37_11960 [candidate division BRC1 bacterium HGW-BRC1-1]|jgi:CysZ protein|nr:MAG: hypothetical protein CVU37_11960 [candidate division BRC1 bacterium HGW-BRC1-1]